MARLSGAPVAVRAVRRLQLLLGVSGALGGCYTPDKMALQDFFKYMDGARWHHNDHWDPEGGNDPCNFDTHWYGVGCIDPCDIYRDGYNCKAGRITALTLHDNNMTGSISNWTRVGALTNLTWVDLSWNKISGSLPAEFGNINNIEVINMAWNKLEGTLPSELGNMNSNGYSELTEFNFANNNLEGTMPSEIAQLSALRMFDVSFNKLSGSIPQNYTDWPQLQVLYLQGNSLEGSLPEEIGKLTDLRYLNASSNKISGTVPPSAGDLRSLQELHMFENNFTGAIPREIGKLYLLRQLRMQDNQLNFNLTKLDTLGNLVNLVTLDFYNNQMYGDVPASIQNLTSLQYLYLQNEHYKPLRMKYCRQRIPNLGKYSYRIVRDEYVEMSQMSCEDPYDTTFTFNSLQDSGVYPNE